MNKIKLITKIFFLMAIATGCAPTQYLLESENKSFSGSRGIASIVNEPVSPAALTVGNPCIPLRYLRKADKQSVAHVRCNVIVSQRDSNLSLYDTKEADVCLHVGTYVDAEKHTQTYLELSGFLGAVEEHRTGQEFKNIMVRSSRISGEAHEKTNRLHFNITPDELYVSDLTPLSAREQHMHYDFQKKILLYEVEEKETAFMGMIDAGQQSISVSLKCSDDVEYASLKD